MDPQNILIALFLIAGLILLLICPSRAGMWRWFGRAAVRSAALFQRECNARAAAQDAYYAVLDQERKVELV